MTCYSSHWFLAIICFPSSLDKSTAISKQSTDEEGKPDAQLKHENGGEQSNKSEGVKKHQTDVSKESNGADEGDEVVSRDEKVSPGETGGTNPTSSSSLAATDSTSSKRYDTLRVFQLSLSL